MKKSILLLILIYTLQTHSQNELTFKIEYKPELIYNQTSEVSSKKTTTYLGPPEYIEKRKKEGKDNPKIKSNNSIIKSVHKTGKLNNGVFSLTIKYEGSGQGIPKDGAIIYGDVKKGSQPKFFSINAANLDDKAKVELLKNLKIQISYLLFSEHKLKVGETFIEQKPEEIITDQYTFNLKNTFEFTLVKIVDNKAFFNINQNFSFTSSNPEIEKNKTTGNGTGKMIYDIDNNFMLLYEMKTDTQMEIYDENPSKRILMEDFQRISCEIIKI
ncbi:hypothetical protein LZZ90_10870 [Flavobacterium sp. SM15]|uniref:hypothetical protein n=1 Tax=Flavobacterium sp. SM15 TaxID=2908005 RepID=UPI001EDB5B03|nr:hypothetical protein [Flavobacterium sp. SM15]MCG2612009.1 hypothetical protein [Flavobacterium sp. SM15]